MIEFVTLLLGLVAGTQQVEIALRPPATAIELRLDGRSVGRLSKPPWRFRVDLGAELAPHELLAIGLDESGREVARARQWLNLPRDAAEARLFVEAGADGWPATARLTWASLHYDQPESIRVRFDDQPIAVGERGRIELPAYARERIHVLTAEVAFAGDEIARAEAIFGGGFGERVTTDLTAVPVVLEARSGRSDASDSRVALVDADSVPLELVSLERSGGEVAFVADDSSRLAVREQLVGVELRMRSLLRRTQDLLPLGREIRFRFVWPVVTQSRGARAVTLDPGLFASRAIPPGSGPGLHDLLRRVERPPVPQRVADAVAVAAVAAASGNRPRAVVLLLDPATPDISSFEPENVRRYLSRLHVPLLIWTCAEPSGAPAGRWGKPASIAGWRDFRRAVKELRERIDGQSIAWVGGSHLPQTIHLAPGSEGVRIAGSEE